MSRVFGYLVLLALLGVVLFFSLLNADAVVLNLHFISIYRPLALYLVIALFVGILLGIIVSVPIQIHARREASKLRRRLRAADAEIKNLRSMPIRDEH